MSELQVQFAAVAFHQTERVELPQMTFVDESAEVALIDLKALAWTGLHSNLSTAITRFTLAIVQTKTRKNCQLTDIFKRMITELQLLSLGGI